MKSDSPRFEPLSLIVNGKLSSVPLENGAQVIERFEGASYYRFEFVDTDEIVSLVRLHDGFLAFGVRLLPVPLSHQAAIETLKNVPPRAWLQCDAYVVGDNLNRHEGAAS